MTELKQQIIDYIVKNSDIFTNLSDEIWANPELSLKEYRSAALYEKVLEENGFRVEKNFDDIETAFTGTFGSGHPVIGILGEYDALSGLSQERGALSHKPLKSGAPGHGCGHNMLGTGALAAAFGIKHYLETSGHEGTVIFFGCPGEEGGAAKAFMARDGIWKDLDAALTWHPEDVNEVKTGTNNSTIQIMYDFHGVSAHAAGDPEHGRSALDAVELMNTGVQYLREHMTSDCRVHYAITDAGGVSPNVVQEHATVLYMVRAGKVRNCVELLKRVDKIAEGAALMTETNFTRTFIDGTADLVPNFTLENVLFENFKEVGLPTYTDEEISFAKALSSTCPENTAPGFASKFDDTIREFTEEHSEHGKCGINNFLIPLYHSTAFQAGSTDVGDVSWETPTAQIHVAGFVNGAPGHSWQNVSCGGSSIGHKALLQAGKVLACAAVDLYEKPEILKEARAEFEKRTACGYVCPIEDGAKPIAI
ncbi:M20 family metallopeptidase [Oribacterium sp. WCC10]|uniref:M20 family metallopeptidase n=1 Tax=Oribacterium sp. WCC10 TaxID=1855343 RepID=UPI0008F15FA8|nr:M20 family metallopeptidase [Oribacterium sp. WCC10]SFG61958.1 aminobenzoyl-glutamate utilization protein B [Oribacterium sp. WCC10]